MVLSRPSRRPTPGPGWALLGVLAACRPSVGAPASIVARLHGTGPYPAAVAIDEAGTAILVASERNEVNVWSAPFEGGTPVFSGRPGGTLVRAAFAGKDAVYAATLEGTVVEWNWKTNSTVFTHKFYGRSEFATISPDGRYVAFGGSLFDRAEAREGEPLRIIERQTALQFSADAKHLLSAAWRDAALVVRDMTSGALRQWRAPEDVRRAALSPRGDRIAAVLRGGEVRVWQLPAFRLLGSWAGSAESRGLCFLQDGAHVVVADEDGVEIREVTTSRRTFRGPVAGKLRTFVVEKDVAAAGTESGIVWLWGLSRGAVIATNQVSSVSISSLGLSPESRRAAVADESGAITLLGW